VEHDDGVIMSRGDELIEMLREDSSDHAARALLSEFSAGYPVERLARLFHSGNLAAVEFGAWIASELGERAAPLLSEMPSLLNTPARAIKFFAIDVILVCAGPDDGPAIAQAITLIEDADEAVRWKAMQLLFRSSETQLDAAGAHLRSEPIRSLTAWLGTGSAQADITSRLTSSDRTTRLFAAAAAARVALNDRGALDLAATMVDTEISTFAREQLEILSFRPPGS
jgi:hypothetical protein